MKTLLALAAVALASASVATAQPFPVFRDVAWGMTVAQVTAIEGRDATLPFAATAFDVPATIRYGFAGGSLVRIDIDMTRAHDSATIAVADATIADMLRAYRAIDATQLYFWRVGEQVRSGEPCAGTLGRRIVDGCALWRADGHNATYGLATQTVDGSSGRILHTLTLEAPTPTAVPFSARPSVLSLR